MADELKYWAFISYSHTDKQWGDWLHGALENYRVPKTLVGQDTQRGDRVPSRVFPVFRDREELPTSADLGAVISKALEQSRYLIVICSPRARQSRWVNQEILDFKKLRRENRVLALIVDGEPNAVDGKPGFAPDTECFPDALKYQLGPDGNLDKTRPMEPIAADARPDKDGKSNARLKLLAGLLDVNYDDLKRRDEQRRRRQQRVTFAVSAALIFIFAILAGVALRQHREAVAQQREAENQKRRVQAQAAADDEIQGRSDLFNGDIPGALAFFSKAYAVNSDKPPLKLMIAFALEKFAELIGSLPLSQGATSAQFSPDGKLVLITTGENAASIWHRDGSLAGAFSDPEGYIRSAVFSGDGNCIITSSVYPVNCGDCAGCKIWDVHSRKLMLRLKTRRPVSRVALSPDDHFIAAVTDHNLIQVFDRADGREICVLDGLTNRRNDIRDVRFAPDSKSCIARREDKIKLWSLPAGKELLSLTSTSANSFSGFDSASFNSTGDELLTTDGAAAQVWSIRTSKQLKVFNETDKQVATASRVQPRRFHNSRWPGCRFGFALGCEDRGDAMQPAMRGRRRFTRSVQS